MAPLRRRSFFRGLLESIRAVVPEKHVPKRAHWARWFRFVKREHWGFRLSVPTIADLRRALEVLLKHKLLSVQLLGMLASMLLFCASLGLRGPHEILVAARGCALGLLLSSSIAYAAAIAFSFSNPTNQTSS